MAIVLAAGLPLVAGCTAHHGQDAPQDGLRTAAAPPSAPASATPPAPAAATPSATASALDLTRTPPDLSGSARSFVRLANRTGSEEVTVIESVQPGTVAVATECAGAGHTTVTLGNVAAYTVRCAAAPSATYNEIRLDSGSHHLEITVTAGTRVHWGLSVGWRPLDHRPS
ncbi:hypothetical protein ACFWIJ_21030 [Streptomyces sp. NPDC127079]|uniref:hypothetical protein n=1 Tax=Streptomyces sp. NPDC127079 TaxID=3347132 RepID=UPI0036626467